MMGEPVNVVLDRFGALLDGSLRHVRRDHPSVPTIPKVRDPAQRSESRGDLR